MISAIPTGLFCLRSIFYFLLLRDRLSGLQHILNKDTVAHCGVVHKDMGDCAHQLAVLDDGATAHADVKQGTKKSCVFLQFLCVFRGKRQLFTYLTRDPLLDIDEL